MNLPGSRRWRIFIEGGEANVGEDPRGVKRQRTTLVLALLLAAGTALAARAAGFTRVRLEVGAFTGPFAGGGWSRPFRASLDPPAAADGRTSFYYRAAPPNMDIALPLAVREGPLRVTVRASTRVRSALELFLGGEPAGRVLVRPGRWERHSVEIPGPRRGSSLGLSLAQRPLPLVRGAHLENPEMLVDYVEVEAPGGLAPTAGPCLLAALVPLSAFLFARGIGFAPRPAIAGAVAAAAGTILLMRGAVLPVALAVPRLLPPALLSGLAAFWLLRRKASVLPLDRALLAALSAAGVLAHGSVAFFPRHSPPDIEIHILRTRDLEQVKPEYGDLLRYGSHLPTPSQTFGQATEALGDSFLIPYSPLPYFAYYALHRAGVDLRWGMTVLNAVLAMAVAPGLWLAARRIWGRGAAWVAVLLYALDLAVWHHLGRVHAPAVLGGALGTAALLFLALRAEGLDSPRRATLGGIVLGVAVLGYSSLVVLFGLFGLVLLALLAVDARGLSPAARTGLAAALAIGGVLSGLLYYFHYLPGLLQGSGAGAGPDLFPGRRFFIFHNESRQSYRIWVLGYWTTLLAGLAAAPLAFRRAAPAGRPILASWLMAWALLMLLKEPVFFPRLLRYAKEDQFLSPLLCLLIGGAVWALPRPWMRWTGAALAVAGTFWIEARDFALHADSLKL